jgi:hypothetical protein
LTQEDFRRGRASRFGVTRILSVIAIAGAITLAACSDSTAPTKTATPAPTPTSPTVSALVALAAELHDASDMFVSAVEDEALRTKMTVAINDLGVQLLAGNADGSRAALAQARTLFANLDDISAIELAPVGLALDYIERKLNEIAPLPI